MSLVLKAKVVFICPNLTTHLKLFLAIQSKVMMVMSLPLNLQVGFGLCMSLNIILLQFSPSICINKISRT